MASKPGPIPKRSDQRRRRNITDEAGESLPEITAAPGARAVVAPAACDEWHSMAKDWFESLAASGQAAFYEPSDWQTARIWAEVLSRQLSTEKMSGAMITAWASSASELLTTEGARRRGRLELERAGNIDEDEAASVTALDAYRAQVGG